MNKKISIVLFGLIVFAGSLLASSNNAFAALDTSSIVMKAALEGVWQCQKSGAYASEFMASQFKTAAFVKLEDPWGNGEEVKLPWKLTNVNDADLNCKEILLGYSKNSGGLRGGLFPQSIKDAKGPDWAPVAKFFAGNNLDGQGGIGYTGKAEESSVNNQGLQLQYKFDSEETNCGGNMPIFSNGKSVLTGPTIFNTNGNISVTNYGDFPSQNGQFVDFTTSCGGEKVVIRITNNTGAGNLGYTITASSAANGSSPIRVSARTTRDGVEWSAGDLWFPLIGTEMVIGLTPDPVVATSATNSVETGDYILRWQSILNMMGGLNDKNELSYKTKTPYAGYNYLALTRQEVYDLYGYYIKDVLKWDVICEGDDNWNMYSSNTRINYRRGGYKKDCAIYNPGSGIQPSDIDSLYGVEESFHFLRKITSIDSIVGILDKLGDLCGLVGVTEGCGEENDKIGETTEAAEDDFNCDKLVDDATGGDGIGAMQWLLCPTMTNTAKTADWVDSITRDMLEIRASNYSNTELTEMWSKVRNVANIVITIFLMVVIFSQVTGRGIDNYGIKKMLPRIIIMAIVVNLSLYICQIAVDLSNILGVGLNGMFGGMISTPSGEPSAVIGVITGIFAAIGPAAGAGAMALSGGLVVALVIAIIALVLIIILAVVVLWVMVALREIIVIFCILISPLAFAAFILPNTQNFYKKWWELFKAALIIFPICGAVSGISKMIRSLHASGNFVTGGIAGELIMMVLPFLIFFLLPTLLKQAIAALGKIGAALSSMGNTVKNGGRTIGRSAMHAGMNSERFKDWSKYRQERAMARRAQNTYNALHGRNNLSARQRDRLRKAQDVLAAHHLRETENRAQTDGDYLDAVRAKQEFSVGEATQDMLTYNNGDYVAGQQALGQLGRTNKVEAAAMYAQTPGLVASKERQFAAQRMGEIRKMYSEQFANYNAADKQNQLVDALSGNDNASIEKMDAAFDALMSTGDTREIMDAISRANFANMNDNMRSRVLQKMGGSGIGTLKGFAKSGATSNFSNYVSSGGLKNYFDTQAGKHALDTATKEELEFLAADNNRMAAIDPEIIANAAVSAANQNQRATDAVRKMIKGNEAAVGALIGAKGLTNMNGDIAVALGPTALASAIADIQKPGNEQLRSSVGEKTKTALGL